MDDKYVWCLWDLVFCLMVSFADHRSVSSLSSDSSHSFSLTLWHLLAKAVLIVVVIYIAVVVCSLLHHNLINQTGCGPGCSLLFLLLRSRGAPHLHNNTTVLDLSSVHQLDLSCFCFCSAVTPLPYVASFHCSVCSGKQNPGANTSGCVHPCLNEQDKQAAWC